MESSSARPTAVMYGMVAFAFKSSLGLNPGRIEGEHLSPLGARVTLRYVYGEVWGQVFAPGWDNQGLHERVGHRFGQTIEPGATLEEITEKATGLIERIRLLLATTAPVEMPEAKKPKPRAGGLVEVLNASAELANPTRRRQGGRINR